MNIPFTQSDGLILLEASLEGEKGVFIFDTGADAIILNQINASTEKQDFQTISGEVSMGTKEIRSLLIGGVEMESLRAFTQDLSHMIIHSDYELLGIVGASIFKSEVLHIDHQNSVLKIYEQSIINDFEDRATVQCDIATVENLIIVPLKIEGKSYNFILDTGASVSLMDADLLADIHNGDRTTRSINILTAKGMKSSSILKLDHAHLNNLKIESLEMASFDSGLYTELLGQKVDGVLAISQLPISETLINYHDKKIYFVL